MSKSIFSLALVSAAFLVPINANAATLFNFSGNDPINGSHANSREFTGSDGTTHVRASAWSIADTTIFDSYLGVYGSGLGVTSGDDGNGGNNTHVIDNSVRRDFILLQFDKEVSLTGGNFTTFSVLGAKRDSDAILGYGSTNANWQSQLPLDGENIVTLASYFSGDFTSLGTGAGGARSFGESGSGNLWLLGADFANADERIDGFKLGALAVDVVSAVPEPATWGMMLVGFGAIGGAMRFRRRDVEAAIA